ncbi:NAD(P)H-dependent D-xylose reductase (XR) [Tulasnella sp. JGI-2019a]|nr:NAD(P)H-dependent D-xylose reductase (XR) [Tulasnella sp. JGI-2019a]KAG9032873.1 NAD(P)H-dependent D-xylose reductase (XR) [Tulasnella sp. JGI-2019a]
MATITLKSGAKMPLVGFGLWKVNKDTCAETVYNAVKAGYRLFDCAGDYGNEKQSGEGLKRAIDEGLIKREDVFITSKLWNTFHAHDHVKQLAKKQLEDWGLSYFDLFLIHFPVALAYVDPAHRYPPEWFGDDGKVYIQSTPIHETWTAMEELVDEGLAKDIGLSNFQGGLILDVLRYAKKPISVLQVEHHPYLTQEPLIKLCKDHDIAVTAYCSFGPQSWVELNMSKGATSLLKDNPTINKIVAETGKTHAQVLLRWATQRGIAVVPKSNQHERLIQNLKCNDFDLTEEQIKEISALNVGLRFNNPGEIDPRLAIFT